MTTTTEKNDTTSKMHRITYY